MLASVVICCCLSLTYGEVLEEVCQLVSVARGRRLYCKQTGMLGCGGRVAGLGCEQYAAVAWYVIVAGW
jgi:hypothetical protein